MDLNRTTTVAHHARSTSHTGSDHTNHSCPVSRPNSRPMLLHHLSRTSAFTRLRTRPRPEKQRRRYLHYAILNFSFLILNCFCASAQKIGIAYYDLDHLYDTIPALFYDDGDYTPGGRLAWDTERYRRKIAHTAAVIDSMRMPLVALWSVENEAVVRDIAAACRGDYSYLHRTLNSLDGMDFALLYYGDLFYPHYVEPGRRYLYVEGVLRRTAGPSRRITGHPVRPARTDTVGLVLCSDTRMAQWAVRDLREERPGVKLIVLGRSASLDAAAYGLRDALERPSRLGRGNVRRRAGWLMRDRILADTAFNTQGGDVYARRYLFDPKTGNPLPTYEKRRYRGGYGYALPVFVYLE